VGVLIVTVSVKTPVVGSTVPSSGTAGADDEQAARLIDVVDETGGAGSSSVS
jgi:hypothetical protein